MSHSYSSTIWHASLDITSQISEDIYLTKFPKTLQLDMGLLRRGGIKSRRGSSVSGCAQSPTKIGGFIHLRPVYIPGMKLGCGTIQGSITFACDFNLQSLEVQRRVANV